MNNLKELRNEHKLLQKDIAKILYMSQTGYSKYEKETRDIPTETLISLAKYYQVSIDYILGISDLKNSYKNSKASLYDTSKTRLKDIREDKDLTQKDIAKYLNMSRSGYSDYESGKNEIPTKTLKKLATFYNVPIDYLLYLTDEREPYSRKKV